MEIELTNGEKSIVDQEDFEILSKYRWTKTTNGYAVAYIGVVDGKQTYAVMHRLVTNAKKGDYVDHINRDKLDNRRSNLRVCSHKDNDRNKTSKKHKTGLKGVYLANDRQNRAKKYRSFITVNYKQIYLGRFYTPEEAAKAYNSAARKYFGEFACVNVETRNVE